jgi:hypothetical protein
MNIHKLEPHPLALTVPEMTDEEYEVLKADIGANGMRDQIILFEDRILDGRHRYRALRELGKLGEELDEKQFAEYNVDMDGDDPLLFVMSKNVKRRHLIPGQLAALAWTKIKPNLKPIGRPKKEDGEKISTVRNNFQTSAKEQISKAAKDAGASPKSAQSFGTLEKESPELSAQVAAGEKSLRQAQREAKEQQRPNPDEYQIDRAYAQLRKVCGPEFYDAVCSGSIRLSSNEVVELAGKTDDDGKTDAAGIRRFKPGLEAGLSYQRTKIAIAGVVTAESRIQLLLDVCDARGGKATVGLDGITIAVSRMGKR